MKNFVVILLFSKDYKKVLLRKYKVYGMKECYSCI